MRIGASNTTIAKGLVGNWATRIKPVVATDASKAVSCGDSEVCNIETIRFYEKRGLLPEPQRSAGGHRLYSEDHQARLQFVIRGRELGFALADIKELIDLAEGSDRTCDDALAMAERQLKAVDEKLVQLQGIRDALVRMTCDCRNGCGKAKAPKCVILEALAR